MTNPNDQAPNAGDYRRAAVLVLHQRRGNTAGVAAIVDETNTANRGPQLLRAVLVLHRTLIGLLRTQSAINLMADWVHGMATLDATEPPGTDITRAAQILEHHGQGNHAGVAAVMNAATHEGHPTEVLLQLLDLYEVALPELSGLGGMEWLEAPIETLVSEEFKPDDEGGGSPS
jgi:hypothetical protein